MSQGMSASHIPVLTLIPKYFHITKVLEIGSGGMSTPLFLNKNIYPDLQELVSVEEDVEWLNKTNKLYSKNEKLTLLTSTPASLYHYDLIFVDGPQSAIKRAKVIHYVMRELIKPLIVVHDIENRLYKKQINKEYNEYLFNFIKSPMTGIYSREEIPVKTFIKFDKLMYKYFDEFQEDAEKWEGLFK